MKQASLIALLFVFIFTAVVAPTDAFAKNGGDDDDDKYEYRSDDSDDDDNDDDDSDDDDNDDDSNDDDSNDSLEVEADVFTDTTIVKVELRNGQKTTFTTTADTRDEVIDVVADKFNLTDSEVSAALDFEIEDRASRAKERAKISNQNNRPIKICRDDSSDSLEVEADVFTDTTIVKVELENGSKTVFETNADTRSEVIDVVADKFDLSTNDVEDALDFEIEDRASRASDSTISSSSNDDCDNTNSSNNGTKEAELRARMVQLQELIQTLIRLLNARLGSSN